MWHECTTKDFLQRNSKWNEKSASLYSVGMDLLFQQPVELQIRHSNLSDRLYEQSSAKMFLMHKVF